MQPAAHKETPPHHQAAHRALDHAHTEPCLTRRAMPLSHWLRQVEKRAATLEEVAGAAVQEAEARMGEAFATQLEVMHARDVAEVEVSCEK